MNQTIATQLSRLFFLCLCFLFVFLFVSSVIQSKVRTHTNTRMISIIKNNPWIFTTTPSNTIRVNDDFDLLLNASDSHIFFGIANENMKMRATLTLCDVCVPTPNIINNNIVYWTNCTAHVSMTMIWKFNHNNSHIYSIYAWMSVRKHCRNDSEKKRKCSILQKNVAATAAEITFAYWVDAFVPPQ